MKHYVVTGGAGFIGNHLIRKLFLQEECRITCIDNFDSNYSSEIKHHNIKDFKNSLSFKLIECDLGLTTASELIDMINEPVDGIIHLAGKVGVRPSIENPLEYQQSNIIGLQNMLDFAKEKTVKQFVFASSSSVYGINDNFPWKEDTQLMPISPYAMTKLSGEMLGHVYNKLFGFRFIAIRFFTVYGPGQRPDLAIHKFIKSIVNNQPISMYGNGDSSRDYTYVDDIVQGILSALHYNQSGFEIINLGNNTPVSLSSLVLTIEEVIGKKAIIKQLPDQAGDVPRTCADINKAKKLLGYNPQTQLKEGIEKFYDWFLENKDLLVQEIKQ